MSRKSKLFRKAHFLLLLLICITLAAGIYLLNAPQRAGTAVARTNNTECANGGATTISCTLTSPANGNTLIASIGTRGTTADRVSSITQTGATWVRATQSTNANGVTVEIWYANNISGAGTGITINLAASLKASAVIAEYSGVLTGNNSACGNTGSICDKTASATGLGTSPGTGTTTTTSQSNQLWIGGMANINNDIYSLPTNSFVEVAEVASTGGSNATKNRTALFERIVTSTGAATVSATLGASQQWSGAIATFNSTGPPTQLFMSLSPNTLTAGVCSSAVTLETRDSSGAPVNASNDVVVQLQAITGVSVPTFYSTSDCSGSTFTTLSFNGSESSKTFYIKDTKALTGAILRATKISGSDTLTDYDLTYNVNAASLARLAIRLPGQEDLYSNGVPMLGTPENQTAGTSFIITSIRALDAFDNFVTSYSGTKTLAYSGPGNAPSGTTPSYTTSVNFTNGVSTTTLTTTLYLASTITTITVTEGGLYGVASSEFAVAAGALSTFDVAVTPGTYIAGNCSTDIGSSSVTAKDAWQNTRTQDTSVINLTANGATNFYANKTTCTTLTTQITLVGGAADFTFIPIRTTPVIGTFTNRTITATKNGDVITADGGNFVVNPAAVSTILVQLPGQSFTPGTGITGSVSFTGLRTPNATSGTSFNVVLHAVDTYNNLCEFGVNEYIGAKTISWSNSTAGNAPSGTAPTYPTTSVTFSAGSSTTTLTATYVNATASRNIRADATSPSVTGTASSSFTVQAAAVNNFGVTASTPQTAGSAFNVTVTARDTYNNSLGSLYSAPAGTYVWSSTAYESPNNTNPSLGALAQGDFTNGVATKSVTLYKAQSVTFTATDPNSITGTSSSTTVNAGSLNNYGVFTNNGTAGTCVTTNNTIRAQDTWGNSVTSDSSTVNMTTSMTGVTFYTTSGCTTTTTQYTLSSGTANFFYKTNKKHSGRFTASNSLPSSLIWVSTVYGDKYVSIGFSSNSAAYSTDGVTWSASTLPVNTNWRSVTYGDGKYVAVSDGSLTHAYSTDGITWTSGTLPNTSGGWRSVTYGGGKFVAISSGSNNAAYSTNGTTWTSATLPTSSIWRSVTYGDGKFVAVAAGGVAAAYSSDGITWASASLPTSSDWSSVTYGNGKFVAVANYSYIPGSSKTAYSTNGTTWTSGTLSTSYMWSDVKYCNGKYYAVVSGSKQLGTSTDGITFANGDYLIGTNWYSVACGNDKILATGTELTANFLGTTNTITATKNLDTISGTSLYNIIDPAATSSLSTKLPGQTFTDGTGITGGASFSGLRSPNATAGTSFSVTLHAVDAYNNLVDSGPNIYTGSKTISWLNSTSGSAPNSTAPIYPATSVTFTNGASTTSLNATYYNATTARTVRADDTGTPITSSASSSFTVQAGTVANYSVTASTPQTAGVAFNVTLTAIDNYGNTLGSLYTAPSGSYVLTSTAANAPDGTTPNLGSLIQANFTNGVATKSVTLYKAETATITASEPSPSTVTGTSSSITINSGSLSANINDSTISGLTSVFVNDPVTFTLTLRDTWRNPIPNLDKTYFSAVSTGSANISQAASNTDSNGQTTFTVSWSTAGSYTVAVNTNSVALVQNDGVSSDVDGQLDSTVNVTVTVPPPSTRLQGGTILRGGTRIQ